MQESPTRARITNDRKQRLYLPSTCPVLPSQFWPSQPLSIASRKEQAYQYSAGARPMMAAQSACPEGTFISVGLDVFRMGARVLVSTVCMAGRARALLGTSGL
jgi:hypothetical protein